MLTAAKFFDKTIKDKVRECLNEYKDYKLKLMGHSLGGGTDVILSMMWKKEFPNLECIAFACPPCVSQELSESVSDYVTSIILNDDIIVRASIPAVEQLRVEVSNFDWRTELEKDIKTSKFGISKIAKGVSHAIKKLIAKGILVVHSTRYKRRYNTIHKFK